MYYRRRTVDHFNTSTRDPAAQARWDWLLLLLLQALLECVAGERGNEAGS